MGSQTDFVLEAQVLLQLAPAAAVEVAELALVGLDLVVLLQVELQRVVAGAREGAFMAPEHQALEVVGQLGAADLQRSHALFWWTEKKKKQSGLSKKKEK